MDFLVRLFKSVSNEKRVKMVKSLIANGETLLETIVRELKLPYKTVARNLKILETAGLVKSRIEKGSVYYSLNEGADLPYNQVLSNLIRKRSEEKNSRILEKPRIS